MPKKPINYDTRLFIKCSTEDKIKIKEKAKNVGKDLSDYARNILLQKKISPKIDLQTLIEIRRIGTNLNQITRRINSSKVIDNPQELLEKIEILTKELEKIKALIH